MLVGCYIPLFHVAFSKDNEKSLSVWLKDIERRRKAMIFERTPCMSVSRAILLGRPQNETTICIRRSSLSTKRSTSDSCHSSSKIFSLPKIYRKSTSVKCFLCQQARACSHRSTSVSTNRPIRLSHQYLIFRRARSPLVLHVAWQR